MTVKVGFIGTGGIAQNHLSNLKNIDGVTVTAFYDLDGRRAEQAALEWNDAKAYSSIREMLDGPKLDGVYICVPPLAHGEAERLVIAQGIPFLVEKPLGVDQDVPTEIAALVANKAIITSVGYHWRYHDSTSTAQRLLANSRLGMALGYWMGGMPMVPWWRVQSGSGGQFVEQTTHIVDLLRFLCGEVTEVYAAYALRHMQHVEGTDVPDVGTVTLKLANGMVATISNTCLLPIGHHVGLDLYTDQGVLEIRGNDIKEHTRKGVVDHKGTVNPYLEEDKAFVHAIRTGDPSGILSDYEDAMRTHQITIAANHSAISGKAISLS